MDQFLDQDRELDIKKQQQMAAAAYFFKKTDQYIAFEKVKTKSHQKSNLMKLSYNFHKTISLSIPNLPPCLHKVISTNSMENKSRKESDRIQVFVQLLSCPETSSCLSIDATNNCISLTNPTPSRKFTASNAPKLFPVDAVINEDCPIMEICSNSLGAVIRSVANGEDACVISFGNVPANELNPIIGSDKSPTSIGIMPCAILWLFNYIKTIRKQEYARFSVRISAAEISGKQEICRDLLLSISNPSSDNQPIHSSSSSSSSSFNSLVEMRAVNVEKAAYYLDYALTERSKSDENGLSHMFLTLHLYQYHLQNDSGISGGRSRLHIIDLGCGRLSEDVESTAPSIQGISKIIYALWSHQRYIPNPDSILAQTLKRMVASSFGVMQTSMIIKVSSKETQYNEALQVVQLASKLYRQKMRSAKLSSSICSDDNSSSSDSFSIRRMTKFRSNLRHDFRRNDRSTNTLSLSSDFDATSSSEVSCDTVIYRGQAPTSPPSNMRTSADGSSQGQIVISQSENENKKSEQKLSLFQMKRRTNNKVNSNAWPKVAVKKGKEVMKSGQELWVDGPEAFCSNNDNTNNNNNNNNTNNNNNNIINQLAQVTTQKLMETGDQTISINMLNSLHEKQDNKEDILSNCGTPLLKRVNKAGVHAMDIMNLDDHLLKLKNPIEKFNNETAVKSKMVTDWLRNQPELHEVKDKINPISLQTNSKINKTDREKGNQVATNNQRLKNQKLQIDPIQIENKTSSTNFSRIEDWIRTVSIESPKRSSFGGDCGVVMTQSLYSPNCSPYHTTEPQFNSFTNVSINPPSAPTNYSSNLYDQNTNSLRGTSVPPASIGSELENECSRLWFYNPMINDRHLMPFVDLIDDTNNNRLPSYPGGSLLNNNHLESLRNTNFKIPQNAPMCQIALPQYDQTLIPGSNNTMNYGVPRYSTLPADSYSPKHNTSKSNQKVKASDQFEGLKSNEIFSTSQNTESQPKITTDIKRLQKETKKKENKKGFGFLNHLIRNKKPKKEISINKIDKEDSTTNHEKISQLPVKTHDCHFAESIDYAKKAGPPLLLSSPYHMITQPKASVTGADSSGHGSDCSSFKETKSAQVSANFNQDTAGYRFLAYRRAGSSGYESVVRDSELSSHNDSASECSAPTNLVLQSKTIIHHNPINNSITTTTPVPSIASHNITKTSQNKEQDKQMDHANFTKESQKVFELIKSEKLCMLEMEQDEMKTELINVLKFFNDDIDGSKKYLESHLSDIENSEDMKSPDIINATNQTLRSVLNRYQSNLTMITSFIGKPH